MRYGIAVAAGLMLLASSQTSEAADVKPQDAAYRTVANKRLSANEAMTEGVARIALRGTVPNAQKTPLARADLLRLCVLLALQDSGKIRTP